MSNEIYIIKPYKDGNVWMFDDEDRNIKREPFVSGADDIIEMLTETLQIKNRYDGFNLFFSHSQFPGYHIKLDWVSCEFGGNWYISNDINIKGWLCPVMYQYFSVAPKHIFAKFSE
jgi:hypothetical protein